MDITIEQIVSAKRALESGGCSPLGYPLVYRGECLPTSPKLTDEQKSIYLKLVELAKTGKIEWENENAGKLSGYGIFICDGTVSVTLELTKDRWLEVANFETRGEQLAGDLAAIAKEQWEAKQKKLVEEFLSL